MPSTDQHEPLPCPHCDYDLTGLTEGSVCPECGAGFDASELRSLSPDARYRRYWRAIGIRALLAVGVTTLLVLISLLSSRTRLHSRAPVYWGMMLSAVLLVALAIWNSWRIARLAERDSAADSFEPVNWYMVVGCTLGVLLLHIPLITVEFMIFTICLR